jgi:hypothetical protein
MKLLYRILIFAIITILSSCGYFTSGTWENDNKNWSRAYNFPIPDSVVLLHSWYWRSPHWTMEQAMYFEIEYNKDVKDNYLSDPTLILLPAKDTINIGFYNYKPKWFLPKPYRFYKIWKGNKDEIDHFMLFEDDINGHLYWTDYQL